MKTGSETWQLEFQFMREAASFPTFKIVCPPPTAGRDHIVRFLQQSGLREWFRELQFATDSIHDGPTLRHRVETLLNEDHIIGLRSLLNACAPGNRDQGEGQNDDDREEARHHPRSA